MRMLNLQTASESRSSLLNKSVETRRDKRNKNNQLRNDLTVKTSCSKGLHIQLKESTQEMISLTHVQSLILQASQFLSHCRRYVRMPKKEEPGTSLVQSASQLANMTRTCLWLESTSRTAKNTSTHTLKTLSSLSESRLKACSGQPTKIC